MRKGILATAIAVAVTAVALAPPAGATLHSRGFKSPSGKIRCFSFSDAAGLRCDIQDATYKPPKHDCHGTGDWGFSWGMGPHGRSHGNCVSDALPAIHHTLAYGKWWKHGSFRCHSQRKGVTCFNADDHGFFLSRKRVRLF